MSVHLGPFRNIFLSTCVLFLFSLGLTAYSAREPQAAKIGNSIVVSILYPFQLLTSKIYKSFNNTLDSYVFLYNVREENKELRDKIGILSTRNSKLKELESENKRLHSLISAQNEHKLEGVVANVIAFNPTSWEREITINKGSDDGIKRGQAVIEGNGVVGQVVYVSQRASRVLLLSDPNSGIDAIVQSSRVRGVVEGAGWFKARWSYVLSEKEVTVGDRIITSGMDGVYPKGLLIGVISKFSSEQNGKLFKKVTVEPAVNFFKLESVFVVLEAPLDLGEEAK